MGLDNGIILKINNKEKFGVLPPFAANFDSYEEDTIDLLYWRKCWNIRNVIFNVLEKAGVDTVSDCSKDMPMTLDTFIDLLYKLNDCYTNEWWTENSDSIWDFDEINGNYHYHLLNAMRMAQWLEDKDPDSYEISFYDSY